MTERKAFKKRVREQMETTGQSYAQAAAQLERTNPAAAKDRPLSPPDVHPASAVVVRLLAESKLALDPVAAYGIGGGIGFMYALFQYKTVPAPLLTLVCQHHPAAWASGILDRLEVSYTTVKNKRDTQKLLDQSSAVLLPLARGHVTWVKQIEFAEREELIVVAIPRSETEVLVFDGRAEHTMSRADLLEAYAATPRKHPAIAIADGATLPDDLDSAIRQGLTATVNAMTGPVLGNAFDVNFGISGLRKWAEMVTGTAKDGWAKAYGEDQSWRARTVECIDHEHTARSAGRPLFVRALTEAGFQEAASHFERSGTIWRAIADAANSISLEQLAEKVGTIVDEESQGIAMLGEEA